MSLGLVPPTGRYPKETMLQRPNFLLLSRCRTTLPTGAAKAANRTRTILKFAVLVRSCCMCEELGDEEQPPSSQVSANETLSRLQEGGSRGWTRNFPSCDSTPRVCQRNERALVQKLSGAVPERANTCSASVVVGCEALSSSCIFMPAHVDGRSTSGTNAAADHFRTRISHPARCTVSSSNSTVRPGGRVMLEAGLQAELCDCAGVTTISSYRSSGRSKYPTS